MLTELAALPLAFVATAASVGWALSSPPYRGAVRPHFDGRVFRNALPTERRLSAIAREGWARGAWPARHVAPHAPAPPASVSGDALRATWVSHATVLVQVDGLNLLTDPVWSEAAGPGGRIGPRRVRNAGVRLEDLPRIDLVLLSHNHYDHLDAPTLRRLWQRDRPRVYTPLGNAALLRRIGVTDVVELDWWQEAAHDAHTRVTATEVRHFSGRGLFDRDRTLWAGFAVHTRAGMIYFAGDTGYGPHFAETRRRVGDPRLALIPIGAYLPRAIMAPVHMNPDEATRAHRDLNAHRSLGIHWGSFRLTAEAHDAPLHDLAAALATHGVAPAHFRALEHGGAWDIDPAAG